MWVILRLIFVVYFSLIATQVALGYDFQGVTYVKNYDGDTITVDLEGVHPLFGNSIPIRLEGIDTPEMYGNGECEKEAAVFARDYVNDVLVSSQRIDLINVKRGKYFRLVAKVIFDGNELSEHLMGLGLAVPYYGGTKEETDWCDRFLEKK